MNGIKIGIGRVSTKEQNPQRQIEAFKKEGIEERYIFIDKETGNGGNLEKRSEYQRARGVVRKGDTVFFDALDRLGRNTKEIEQEWRYFTEEIGCYVVVMNMPLLDTRPRCERNGCKNRFGNLRVDGAERNRRTQAQTAGRYRDRKARGQIQGQKTRRG